MAFTLEELYNMQHGGAGMPAEQPAAETDAEAEAEAPGSTAEETDEARATATAEQESVVAPTKPDADTAGRLRALEAQLQEATVEIEVLRERLGQHVGSDPFQEEMIDLLRSEVTQLQTEVTQRDARIQELSAELGGAGDGPGVVSEDEVTGLCARLEDLLAELEQKDHELSALQSHLRVAEEATDAEQEERRQLESWLSEIEERISQRDAEWEASLSSLQSRLAQAQDERREAETSAGAASGDPRVEALQRVVSTLREEKDQLLGELEAEREKVRHLERELEDERNSESRRESVEMCQERAELARQRFELEKLKRELEEQRAVEGSDLRIKALRDHLKEVHTKEEREREERYQKSLAGRVARLWNRLDNH